MGGKSTPKAPDYTAAAVAQGESSKENTTAQTWANRPTINTPWGQQSWQSGTAVDPATGQKVTSWTQNTTLSPDQQQALDAQNSIQATKSQGAQTLADQAVSSFQTPMDWNALPDAAGNVTAGTRQQYNPSSSVDGALSGVQTAQQAANGVQQAGAVPGLDARLGGSDVGDWRQKAQDAMWSMQQPMMEQQRAARESQLTNMGITRGSDAWNTEMRNIGDQESRAQLGSIAAGRDEASMLYDQALGARASDLSAQGQGFGQALARQGQSYNQALGAQSQDFGQGMAVNQANNATTGANLQDQMSAGNFNNTNRQQAISEEAQKRGQTLNELNALLTGQQVNMPTMPSFNTSTKADTTNFMGAAQNQYGAALDASNAQNAGAAGLTNGLFGLGSAALMFSDERLKTDITKLFTLPNGINVYKYRFIGKKYMELGVIAQEVLKVMPEAVRMAADGFYRVNYDMVLA